MGCEDLDRLTADLAKKTKLDILKIIGQNSDLLLSALKGQSQGDKIWAAKAMEASAASVCILALQDLLGLEDSYLKKEVRNHQRRVTVKLISSAIAFASTWIVFETLHNNHAEKLQDLEEKLRSIIFTALTETGLFTDEILANLER